MSESEITRKCPSCGSPLSFSPGKDSLVCSQCGNLYALEESRADQVYEHEYVSDEVLEESPETITVHCPNCGADSTFPENQVAGFCEFCRTPLVGSSLSVRSLRPNGILPFVIPRDDATSTFKSWLSKRWFLPSGVKKTCRLAEVLTGVYRPLWTFDFETTCHYRGECGIDYYVEKERKTQDGKTETVRVRKTRWHYVSGVVYNTFDDVKIYGSSQVSRDIQQKVGGWHLGDCVNYDEAKVLGFHEESYDVSRAGALEEAQEAVSSQIDISIRRHIGGDHQRIHARDIDYTDITYKLLLVPFWQGRYFFKSKDYVYLVNGETGVAYGERPWSVWKILAFVTFMVAACSGIMYWCGLLGNH